MALLSHFTLFLLPLLGLGQCRIVAVPSTARTRTLRPEPKYSCPFPPPSPELEGDVGAPEAAHTQCQLGPASLYPSPSWAQHPCIPAGTTYL